MDAVGANAFGARGIVLDQESYIPILRQRAKPRVDVGVCLGRARTPQHASDLGRLQDFGQGPLDRGGGIGGSTR